MPESFFRNDAERRPAAGSVPDLDDQITDAGGDSDAHPHAGTEEGRLWAILAYLPILCFIPLLNMKEDPQIRAHARQGVILFLIELVAVIFLIVSIADFVFKAILILAIALSIVGIYFAAQGKSYKLPIISDLADKTKL